MTEPFPSKAYQELCIEKRDELPEWEPKFGDWALLPGKEPCIIMGSSRSALAQETWIVQTKDHRAHFFASALIPLPTQRQLQKMIEERGYGGALWFNIPTQSSDGQTGMYSVEARHKDSVVHYPLREGEAIFEILTVGPDPETALLRCLLAVIEKEEKDE